MPRRLALAATLISLALPAAAHAAAPTVTVDADPETLLGRVMQLEVVARSATAPINGVEVRQAGAAGGFAESACRAPRSVGGTPKPAGPLRAGREVTFEVPFVPQTVGVHVLEVTVSSGDCGPRTERTTTRHSITVTLPQGPVLPDADDEDDGPLPPLPIDPLARSSQTACVNADLLPSPANLRAARAATVCLINAERAQDGLRRLRTDRRLRRAATAHAADMLARRFFAHDAPGGPDLAARVKKVRYWPAVATENLGTATGALATPRQMVEAWMNSEGHRFNILDRTVRQIGVSVAYRMFSGEEPGATYVVNFGWKP